MAIGDEPNHKEVALLGRPGLVVMLPTGPVRALWTMNQRLFAASATHVYEVFVDGTIGDVK